MKNNNPTPSLQHFMMNLIKSYKGLFSVIALVEICWAFINTFLPYTLKLIIDHVVGFAGNQSDLFQSTQLYVFAYIALWIGLCINMRLLDWESVSVPPTTSV